MLCFFFIDCMCLFINVNNVKFFYFIGIFSFYLYNKKGR